MGSSRNSSQYNNFHPKVDSNPIVPRVRRKRQRLPPNLLIENASDRVPLRCESVLPEAFPIKPSDNPSRISSSVPDAPLLLSPLTRLRGQLARGVTDFFRSLFRC